MRFSLFRNRIIQPVSFYHLIIELYHNLFVFKHTIHKRYVTLLVDNTGKQKSEDLSSGIRGELAQVVWFCELGSGGSLIVRINIAT